MILTIKNDHNVLNSTNCLIDHMFEKHCQTCGIEVDKKTAPKRFGRYFCSEDHSQQYLKKKEEYEKRMEEEERKHPRRRGGCC